MWLPVMIVCLAINWGLFLVVLTHIILIEKRGKKARSASDPAPRQDQEPDSP